MNRLTFLKRLFGGVVAAPVVAKALAEEKAPLPLPSFPARNLNLAYPVMSGVTTQSICFAYTIEACKAGDLVTIRSIK